SEARLITVAVPVNKCGRNSSEIDSEIDGFADHRRAHELRTLPDTRLQLPVAHHHIAIAVAGGEEAPDTVWRRRNGRPVDEPDIGFHQQEPLGFDPEATRERWEFAPENDPPRWPNVLRHEWNIRHALVADKCE